MNALAIVSMVGLIFVGVSPAAAATARESRPAACPTVSSVRVAWPIAREASGAWGVVGEVVARPAGRAATVQSLTLSVEGAFGRPLQRQTFDTPAALAEVVVMFTHDAAGAQVQRPKGTLTLAPDDVAVAFLSALIDPPALPQRARVTLRFTQGAPQSIAVPLEVFSPRQRLAFPLRLDSEPWVAFNTAGTPHHWVGGALVTPRDVFISQRFAIDLVQFDAAFETHPAGTLAKESHYAWGEPVLSAGDGVVVAAVSDQRDIEVGEDPDPLAHPAGNHVVIQYGPGLFAVYAHLQQGSPTVRAGDRVGRGRVIGLVGNSGNTSEPHLHVHFMDRWAGSDLPLLDFYVSQGLPALFWGAQVVRDGRVLPLRGTTPLELDVIVAADRP